MDYKINSIFLSNLTQRRHIFDNKNTGDLITDKNEIEDLLDFDFQTFEKYCEALLNFYKSQEFTKCKCVFVLVNQFFNESIHIFHENQIDSTLFILILRKFQTLNICNDILLDQHIELYDKTIEFLSILLYIHQDFLLVIMDTMEDTLKQIFFNHFLLIENRVLFNQFMILFHNIFLFNKNVVYFNNEDDSNTHEFFNNLFIKLNEESDDLYTEISFIIMLFHNFHLNPLQFPLINEIIEKGITNKIYFPIVSLVYYCTDAWIEMFPVFLVPKMLNFLFEENSQTLDSEYQCILFHFLVNSIIKCNDPSAKSNIIRQIINLTKWDWVKRGLLSSNPYLVENIMNFIIYTLPDSFNHLVQCYSDKKQLYLTIIEIGVDGKVKEKEKSFLIISKLLPVSYDIIEVLLDSDFVDSFISFFDLSSPDTYSIPLDFLEHLISIYTSIQAYLTPFFHILIEKNLISILEEIVQTGDEDLSLRSQSILSFIEYNFCD